MGVTVLRSCLLLATLLLSFVTQPALSQINPQVRIKTDQGEFVVELYPDKAPVTVENFLAYVRRYYYDGLIFHRVVKGFVIQTGGYTFDLSRKEPDDPIVNESSNGLKNDRGTLAMARLADPDSATSQFYINLANNRDLNPRGGKPGYTVFGRVISGMETVDAIGKLPVVKLDQFSHLPEEDVSILSIREIESP